MKCAVLGATGVVGQHFLKLLEDHPEFELAAVCASDARTGQPLSSAKELISGGIPAQFKDIVFDPMQVDALLAKDIKLVFSALPASIAKDFEMEAAAKGINVFSNASAYRMDPGVPILIPEINYDHLQLVKGQLSHKKGYIVTNANCTTTGLAMALLPIQPLGIRRLIIASYQAISGSGYPGHSALDMTANVIPYIAGEEPKVLAECRKIFGEVAGSQISPTTWEIHAHCLRVATVVGHMISVHVELEKEADEEMVQSLFQAYESPDAVKGLATAPLKPVIFSEDPLRPQPRLDVDAGTPGRARGMAVTVGRLSVDGPVIRFVTLSNNLVRGAAGGSILNAELARRENIL